MGAVDLSIDGLVIYYMLLIIPLGLMLWLHIPMVGKTLVSIVRMTLQLAFVGLYLQVVFKINSPWLNSLWLVVMVGVADFSIIRGCGLRLSRFASPLFAALVVGTAVPLLFFVGPLLKRPNLMDAQYVIPIGGMILGNCLRADIIGIKNFYSSLQKGEKAFLHSLAQGARLKEAILPYLRDACEAALMPTVATIATIGLVALPGMMTGVILGGANPVTAIKYQIAIMIAIFTGTAITVVLAIIMTIKTSFTSYGVLDSNCFRK
ncbi:MAG: ABC transporter permease [Deltaproteobacteria bacterium]|nr:ABC transporter permease [Deltaproteobacteria bacterium]MBW1930776.1 ABC transporter permease [Deltaproteobacteria bacterium]MBW2024740.1 ABC transporter permease [Deltaproteobacteria bacterium]MBW2125551.1 ABC transporter permease [Deltaproteobacteria bacterium]RLB22550.1 MAG: ABC transporter permease [Deltaproteobacteria bacterium]